MHLRWLLVLGALVLCLPLLAQGAVPMRSVQGTVRQLGSEAPLAGFQLCVLMDDGARLTRTMLKSDASGSYTLTVATNEKLRFFATGAYLVPPNWRVVARSDKDVTHDLWVRTLEKVDVRGIVMVSDKRVAARAQVSFAELDTRRGDDVTLLSVPHSVHTDNNGTFSIQVPAGVYQVWARWSDRDTEQWEQWFCLIARTDIFETRTLSLVLAKQPRIKGRVIDGSTGKPMAAMLDLYTHEYLKQFRIFTSDDDTGHEAGKKTDTLASVGVFDEQLSAIDTGHFTVVVAETLDRQAIRLYPNLDVQSLNAMETLALRDPKAGKVRLRIKTRDRALAVHALDVAIAPKGVVAAPNYVRPMLRLEGVTDEVGEIVFWGLPAGNYGVYSFGGEYLIAQVELDGGQQIIDVTLDVPFAMGKLSYPDGSPCTLGVVTIEYTLKDGFRGPPLTVSAFRHAPLARAGKYFVLMLWPDTTYRMTFGAPKPGAKELPYVASAAELDFVSEPWELVPGEGKAFEKDIPLKGR